MAMIDDINEFAKYISDTYGCEIKVARFVNEPLTRDSHVIDIWATAVAEHFKCDKDKIFRRSRQGNSIEKVWLQYFLVTKEQLQATKIYKMFGYKDHTPIYSNTRVCDGYKDVYPEIYESILSIYDREIKKLNLDKKIRIL